MTLPTLYPGMVNSPSTTLTSPIDDDDTTIAVAELSVFPSADNIAVIGEDDEESPETIKYTGKSAASGAGNLTGVERAFQGTAQSWGSGIKIRRNFTEYDYDAICDNIVGHDHTGGDGAAIAEGALSLSDVTTADASSSAHGFCPKLSDDETEVLNGAGEWTDSPHRASLARQAIINGNFDIWQRGTSLASLTDSTNTYLADRWYFYGAKDGGTPPTIAQSRQVQTPGALDNSFFHYRVAVDGAGSSYGNSMVYGLFQKIEHGTRYLCGDGKKITISFKARSSIANKKIGVLVSQTYGTGGSPSSTEVINGDNFALTSDWQEFSLTLTTNTLSGKTFGSNYDDSLILCFYICWGSTYQDRVGASAAETWGGSGNVDIAQVQVCAGDIALPFEPKSFAEELLACQRYYQKSYQYNDAPGTVTAANTIQIPTAFVRTPYLFSLSISRMRVQPSVIVYSRGTGSSGKVWDYITSSDTNASVNTGDCLISLGPYTSVADHYYGAHWTADAEL